MTTEQLLTEAAAGITEVVERIFALLREGADEVVEIYERYGEEGMVRPEDLQPLRQRILNTLERVPAFQGTGFVADPSGLREVPRYEEWWHRTADGQVRFLALDMDPTSANTYNYVGMPYFTGAKTGRQTVAGPYLDYTGSELHVLTFAVPVAPQGRFVGVSAADVPVGEFEKLVARLLLLVGRPAVLVNADERVVASASASFAPGDRARDLVGSVSVADPDIGWRLGFVELP